MLSEKLKIIIEGKGIKKYVIPNANSLTMGSFDNGIFDYVSVIDDEWVHCKDTDNIDFYVELDTIGQSLITQDEYRHGKSYYIYSLDDFTSNLYALTHANGFEINTNKVQHELTFTLENLKSSLLKFGCDYEVETIYSIIGRVTAVMQNAPIVFEYANTRIPLIGYKIDGDKITFESLYENLFYVVPDNSFPSDYLYVISTPNDVLENDTETKEENISYSDMTLQEKQDMYSEAILDKLKLIKVEIKVLFYMMQEFPGE